MLYFCIIFDRANSSLFESLFIFPPSHLLLFFFSPLKSFRSINFSDREVSPLPLPHPSHYIQSFLSENVKRGNWGEEGKGGGDKTVLFRSNNFLRGHFTLLPLKRV